MGQMDKQQMCVRCEWYLRTATEEMGSVFLSDVSLFWYQTGLFSQEYYI